MRPGSGPVGDPAGGQQTGAGGRDDLHGRLNGESPGRVHTPSPVLTAMGPAGERALGAIRLSLGRWTTGDDIETAAAALLKAAAR